MTTPTPARIHITSCETGPEAWTHQRDILLQAAQQNERVEITASPEEADFIFLTDLRDEDRYLKLRNHPSVKKFPRKVFAYSDADEPPRFVRGILTSLTHSLLNAGRFQSGSYFLYHPDFRNSYVEAWHRNGLPPHGKKYLFSFMGRNCNPLRAALLGMTFKRPDILIQDTSGFKNFTHSAEDKDARKLAYAQALIESKFVLCPRGNGASSIRLFEAMQLGVAPVIISDEWVLPEGPDWSQCSIQIPARDLGRLESILSTRESEAEQLGAKARQVYEAFFDGPKYVDYLINSARKIQKRSLLPEPWIHRAFPVLILLAKVKHRLLGR